MKTISSSQNTEVIPYQKVLVGDQEFLLLGTAHISQQSIEQVQQTIQAEKPDVVCVELDAGRLKALENPDRWKNLDIKAIIRQGQLATLVANLMLASYQKRMGEQTGVQPGKELYTAVLEAREHNIPVELIDRDVKITLKRAWGLTSFWRKFMLLGSLVESLFDRTEVTEEQLNEIKQQDTMSAMMDEFGAHYPQLRKAVIDERDHFLAGKLLKTQGKKVLAVVGAGHVPGIIKLLQGENTVTPEEELNQIPPSNSVLKWIGWGIPVLLLAALAVIGLRSGMEDVMQNVLYWILVTGTPAALGTSLALAHPLTILTGFVAAPFTTLHPLIGVSTFTALVQAILVPPRVYEVENISDDISHWKCWWKNRMLRIFLCFLLPGLPTTIGTFLGYKEIFGNALQ